MMLHVIGLIIGVCVFAASNDWRTQGDMRIEYYPRLQRAEKVVMKARSVNMDGDRTLYDVAAEQLLAGYYLLPEIQGCDRHDPLLLTPNVRKIVCQQKPFVSPTLQECLQRAQSVLEQTGEESRPGRLSAETMDKRFYPAGKTRCWSVVAAKSAKRRWTGNTIRLVFIGEDDVLEGVLCDKAQESTKATSLLDVKRRFGLGELSRGVSEDIPTAIDLLSSQCTSKYNLGVIYYPVAGRRVCALLAIDDCCGYRYSMGGKAAFVQESSLETLKTEAMKGYRFKQWEDHQEDIDVLRQPSVRKVFCSPKSFESRVLSEALGRYKSLLKDKDRAFQGCGGFWSGLTEDHCKESMERNSLKWFVVGEETLRSTLRDRYVSGGTLILIPKGETVAFVGQPIFFTKETCNMINTLYCSVAQAKIKQAQAIL